MVGYGCVVVMKVWCILVMTCFFIYSDASYLVKWNVKVVESVCVYIIVHMLELGILILYGV